VQILQSTYLSTLDSQCRDRGARTGDRRRVTHLVHERLPSHVVGVGNGLLPLCRVDDELNPIVLDQVHHVGSTIRHLVDAITSDAAFREEIGGSPGRDDPETVNAFCMAGGKMAIYSGLILKLNATDDEIAQVMGHEIAHALSAHTAEKMSVTLATDLAVTAFAVTRDEPGVALAGASLAAALAIKLPNSRTAESEADVIGIELAARAGYDPNAAVNLWKKMAEESGSSGEFDFFSTHPAPEKRRQNLRKLVPKMMPYYEEKGDRPVYPLKSG